MTFDPNLEAQLAEFTGTENYYRHWTNAFDYTDGVRFLADNAGAWWLLDLIASLQPRARRDPMLRDFQLWVLCASSRKGIAHCLRDTNDQAFCEEIEYTDFPLDRIELYLEGGVLMLPSER